MPRMTQYRNWCKSCNNFTLHTYPSMVESSDLTCSCGTVWTAVTVGEIDKDKVAEQRKRFRNKRKEHFGNMLGVLSSRGSFSSYSNPEVVETDAGLDEVERLETARRSAERKAIKDEIIAFRQLGRNDSCLCGSGLKYKKCCYSKHQRNIRLS